MAWGMLKGKKQRHYSVFVSIEMTMVLTVSEKCEVKSALPDRDSKEYAVNDLGSVA